MPAAAAPRKRGLSLSVLFLIIALGFFVLALAAGAYFLVFGGRSISTDHVTITVDGPTTIGSGDVVPLAITIQNQNPTAITGTALSIDFPDGARSADDATQALAHYTDTAGDIAPGASASRTVRASLFGSENQKITIPLRLEYHVAGSNAVFVKEAKYEVTITSSPLSVTAQSLSQVSAGQPITLTVTVRSNATAPVDNVAVLAQYPFGFSPTGASASDGPLFPVGTLAPGESKTLSITGSLKGEDGDERVFHFTVGTSPGPDASTLSLSYTTTDASVTPGQAVPRDHAFDKSRQHERARHRGRHERAGSAVLDKQPVVAHHGCPDIGEARGRRARPEFGQRVRRLLPLARHYRALHERYQSKPRAAAAR